MSPSRDHQILCKSQVEDSNSSTSSLHPNFFLPHSQIRTTCSFLTKQHVNSIQFWHKIVPYMMLQVVWTFAIFRNVWTSVAMFGNQASSEIQINYVKTKFSWIWLEKTFIAGYHWTVKIEWIREIMTWRINRGKLFRHDVEYNHVNLFLRANNRSQCSR